MLIFKILVSVLILLITSCQPKENLALNLNLSNTTQASQDLNYKFTPSSSTTKTWILIHGLGDDMSKLESLAELAKAQGYPVLQMDLHGHGQTLFNYLRKHPHLPDTFDYEKNVVDIENLITKLEIKNDLVIVGHSYGGAIAYALAARLEKNKTATIQSVHLLAPYVQRIDKFLKMTYNPFRPPQLDQLTDPLLDPVLDQYMEKTFRTYLKDSYYHDRNDLNLSEETDLKFRIEAVIKCTKGIRRFDLLDRSQKLIQFKAPLQIIGAENDAVVTKDQLESFDNRLLKENIPHTLMFLDDKNVGHLFPRKLPDSVFKAIDSFK